VDDTEVAELLLVTVETLLVTEEPADPEVVETTVLVGVELPEVDEGAPPVDELLITC
jgi:hypothetical protein